MVTPDERVSGITTDRSASLRAAGNCPTGMYLTPSPDTLLKWHGVFFVHRGRCMWSNACRG
jgi:hypothetical protein